MGLLYTGSRLLPMACVTGYRRVPDPPARIMPLYRVPSVMIPSIIIARCRTSLTGIMRRNPLPVGATGHIAYPRFIIKIPAHCLAKAAFQCCLRLPTQFALDLASVHGVAAIMSRPVLHKRDQLTMRTCCGRRHLVHQVADRVYDLKVRLLIPTADVVRLSDPPAA